MGVRRGTLREDPYPFFPFTSIVLSSGTKSPRLTGRYDLENPPSVFPTTFTEQRLSRWNSKPTVPTHYPITLNIVLSVCVWGLNLSKWLGNVQEEELRGRWWWPLMRAITVTMLSLGCLQISKNPLQLHRLWSSWLSLLPEVVTPSPRLLALLACTALFQPVKFFASFMLFGVCFCSTEQMMIRYFYFCFKVWILKRKKKRVGLGFVQ